MHQTIRYSLDHAALALHGGRSLICDREIVLRLSAAYLIPLDGLIEHDQELSFMYFVVRVDEDLVERSLILLVIATGSASTRASSVPS